MVFIIAVVLYECNYIINKNAEWLGCNVNLELVGYLKVGVRVDDGCDVTVEGNFQARVEITQLTMPLQHSRKTKICYKQIKTFLLPS